MTLIKCAGCATEEMVDHIVSGCPELSKTEYIQTQQGSCICTLENMSTIQVLDMWYEHEPATVTENKEAMILWDMQIHTDREIATNK